MPRRKAVKNKKKTAAVVVEEKEKEKPTSKPSTVIAEVVVPAPPAVTSDNKTDVTSSPSSSSTAVVGVVVVEASNDSSNSSKNNNNNNNTGSQEGDGPSNISSGSSSDTAASNGSSSGSTNSAALAKPGDPKWGNLDSMPQITKSPYEPNESAEIGEAVFDELKTLVVHQADGTLHPQAACLFGHRLAESVVSAFQQIGVSGMLFSPSWQEGKIRGVQCGWIPKALLLLCLHEQRFTRSTEDAVLMSIIKDLGVTKIISDCMKHWNLEDGRLSLVASLGGFSFLRKKLVCLKCAIFVARAFRCVTALKHEKPSDSLLDKVKKCLDIMNQNIRVNKGGLVRLQAEIEKEKQEEIKKKEREALKKKRRREMEQELELANKNAADLTIVSSAAAGGTTENDSSSSSERSRKRIRRQDQSLPALLGMFEEQYKRMGETLAIIRQKVQESQKAKDKATREAIRAEILQEMKAPKKNGKNSPKK